jgi:hypothetical protein
MALNGKFWRNKRTGDIVTYSANDNLAKFDVLELVEFKGGVEISVGGIRKSNPLAKKEPDPAPEVPEIINDESPEEVVPTPVNTELFDEDEPLAVLTKAAKKVKK